LEGLVGIVSSRELSDVLEIELVNDENYRGNEEYAWYIKPRSYDGNLVVNVGWKSIEYAILSEDNSQGSNDKSDSDSSSDPSSAHGYPANDYIKLSLWSIYEATREHSEKLRRLCMMLQARFAEERLTRFNKLYHTALTMKDIGTSIECMPMMLVLQRDDEIFLEFTLRDPETFQPHDYKLRCERNVESGELEWTGLGDNWEQLDKLDILQLFWNEETHSYNDNVHNTQSETMSYIFEFIVYATH